MNLHRQQVHAGCLVLLKVRAWTAGLRQVDGVVGVAAHDLGAEIVEILASVTPPRCARSRPCASRSVSVPA